MSRRRRGVRLEMTALMDVMFLVLVFFIYSVFEMSVHRGMKVDLPRATGSAEPGDRIVLTIASDDSLQLEGVSVTRADVVARMRRLVAAKVDLPVLVSGDRRATLGAGLELVAELKAAGVSKIDFQVSGTTGERP